MPLIRTLWASSVRSMARPIMGRKGNPSWVTSGTHDGAQTGPMIGSTKRPNYIIAFPLFNSLRLPRDSNGPSWINVLQRLRPILYRSSHSPNRRRGEASSGRYGQFRERLTQYKEKGSHEQIVKLFSKYSFVLKLDLLKSRAQVLYYGRLVMTICISSVTCSTRQ